MSAWQCKFDGGYNTSPFLPSFLPSLRECYHSISLPATLAELQMGFSLWTLCCSVGYTQYRRRKIGKKGWLSNTEKAFLVFPRHENLIWNKGSILLNWRWDFSMKGNKSCFSPLPQTNLFSPDWFGIVTAWPWCLRLLLFFFFSILFFSSFSCGHGLKSYRKNCLMMSMLSLWRLSKTWLNVLVNSNRLLCRLRSMS